MSDKNINQKLRKETSIIFDEGYDKAIEYVLGLIDERKRVTYRVTALQFANEIIEEIKLKRKKLL